MLVNLVSFVKNPFTKKAEFEWGKYAQTVQKGQRLMDDMIDLEIEQIDKIISKVDSDPEPDRVKRIEKEMWGFIKDQALRGRRTGLGITGLALALAARDSVANIFGAISIIIDQPFNVGDWILVDDIEGEVVQIGLRTTLIRSSADTLITVPNSNLVNSPVENFSQRRFRRIQPKFEFEADSDPTSLKDFCDKLLAKVKDDPRAVKDDDSLVKVNAFGPSKVTVSCNFYSVQSSSSQREMTEDLLLLAKEIAKDCGLTFHEPRLRR